MRPRRPSEPRARNGVSVIRALFAVLLLVGISWPATAEDAKPLTAILLVAHGQLPDPNFDGATVLVMNDIANGPLGLIVNRPTRITVSQLFPDVRGGGRGDDKVYFGGPVDLETVSFLFRADAPPEHGVQVLDGLYLSQDRELLRELLQKPMSKPALRIFIGYAGWTPDQLENEIARGDWTLAPASSARIFDATPEHAWPESPTPEGQRI